MQVLQTPSPHRKMDPAFDDPILLKGIVTAFACLGNDPGLKTRAALKD